MASDLDRIVEPLRATCTTKVKAHSVKQEFEKQDELKRSALRAVAELLRIPDSGACVCVCVCVCAVRAQGRGRAAAHTGLRCVCVCMCVLEVCVCVCWRCVCVVCWILEAGERACVCRGAHTLGLGQAGPCARSRCVCARVICGIYRCVCVQGSSVRTLWGLAKLVHMPDPGVCVCARTCVCVCVCV